MDRRDGAEPLSNRTLAKDRAVLHRVFRIAEVEWGVPGRNPVARVKAPRSDDHDPLILPAEQYDRLVEECRQGPGAA